MNNYYSFGQIEQDPTAGAPIATPIAPAGVASEAQMREIMRQVQAQAAVVSRPTSAFQPLTTFALRAGAPAVPGAPVAAAVDVDLKAVDVDLKAVFPIAAGAVAALFLLK